MYSLVFITFALAGNLIHIKAVPARGPQFHFKDWPGYQPGDRYFNIPGADGKIYKVDSWQAVDEEAIRNYTETPVHHGSRTRATSGFSIRFKDWKGYKDGDRFFYFAADNGNIYKVDAWDPVDEDAIRNYTCCPVNNGYWLYTRSNPTNKQDLIMDDKASVIQSNFDPKKVTIFTSHGWTGDGRTEMNLLLTKAFLKNQDVNVIVLDWSTLAKRNYVTARYAVPAVGRMLGKFINWLNKVFALPLNKVHIVGHSLGGHVVGNAGKELNGRARRITALDPAGPLWYLDPAHRVAKTDAQYVEIIHTNSFMCGYPFPSGHSDHYPNGGKLMVGCRWWDIVCHHARSWRYMAASIEYNRFYAHKCINLVQAWNEVCTGPRARMGNADLNKHQRGLYEINTKAKFPYI